MSSGSPPRSFLAVLSALCAVAFLLSVALCPPFSRGCSRALWARSRIAPPSVRAALLLGSTAVGAEIAPQPPCLRLAPYSSRRAATGCPALRSGLVRASIPSLTNSGKDRARRTGSFKCYEFRILLIR